IRGPFLLPTLRWPQRHGPQHLDLLPQPALDTAAFIQTATLAMAMFALGLNVHLRSIVKLGPRPAILGAIATATIIIVGLVTSTLTMHFAS
ncbi:putative sulfate exporter family transporter, partial [Gulosibacter hominis]|uniref:putative sulfate exporter family transporter n=1 Tax=Gulosibacter hominis TaxID=2770504 RepID=UPI002ED81C9D